MIYFTVSIMLCLRRKARIVSGSDTWLRKVVITSSVDQGRVLIHHVNKHKGYCIFSVLVGGTISTNYPSITVESFKYFSKILGTLFSYCIVYFIK